MSEKVSFGLQLAILAMLGATAVFNIGIARSQHQINDAVEHRLADDELKLEILQRQIEQESFARQVGQLKPGQKLLRTCIDGECRTEIRDDEGHPGNR